MDEDQEKRLEQVLARQYHLITRKERLEKIATDIRDNHDTGAGVQLRHFLWSLYNMHHLVNLWTLASRVNEEAAGWISTVMEAAVSGKLREDEVKRALLLSGEMQRWDREFVSSETLQRFEEAENSIRALIRIKVPGRAHTDLVALLREFSKTKEKLKEMQGESKH